MVNIFNKYLHAILGDPVLRQKTEEIPEDTIKSNEVQLLIKHMVDVMRSHKLVGLTCNQIGLPYRILTMEFKEDLKKEFSADVYEKREMQTLPLTIVINAKLSPKNYEKVTHVEGCGSVKGFSAEVPRFKAITLEGFNETGNKVSHILSGWNARIAQHEVDHLDGIVYIDKMNSKTFCCSNWNNINQTGGNFSFSYGLLK